MIQFTSPADLRAWVAERHGAGQRVGFVPTMGALHEGHLVLVGEARRRNLAVVMSIFVNPLQFGPTEDFAHYPRDLERAVATARGVEALFVPSVETMYPTGAETRIVPGAAASRWEGKFRPGHFTGVLTVVAKLFHLVLPDVAVFGQKDFQQAALVRQMVRDLDFALELLVVPTVREADGLALSSRNSYLGPEERLRALALSRGLQAAHEAWRGGERSGTAIELRVRAELEREPGITVEYVAVVDPERLEPRERVDSDTIVAVAARVGKTRLIDNIVLSVGVR
jgi:pantoate--beta-alanine ligase